ncbi:hypothetical protein FRB99_006914 [Tulasnella sp. 403]|nr:hypothetical protein FRB99_006914 [Tulasnella sp. 403]
MSSTAKSDPFAPKVSTTSTYSPSQSSQDVTIPYIPELFDPDYLDKLFPKAAPSVSAAPANLAPSHPFMDALREEANMTRTDNNAPAFASTKSLALDAFSTLDQNTSTAEVHKLIRESWSEDPESTLRIIWNLRSIHEGKGAKYGFYRAFGWLYANHPKTAIGNLEVLVNQVIERKKKLKTDKPKDDKPATDDISSEWTKVEESEDVERAGLAHGYYKDLLNLLCLAVSDSLGSANLDFSALEVPRPDHNDGRHRRKSASRVKKGETKRTGKEKAVEQKDASELAAAARKKAHVTAHEQLVSKLTSDARFKALYIAVSRIFAKSLAADKQTLKKLADPATPSAEKLKLKWSLTPAAKWAPSLQCFHDRTTNIATGIALAMYANGNMEGLKQVRIDAPLDAADAHTVRGYYRRWIISPLRRYMEVPEIKMSDKEWNKIDYSRVSSQCMARNKEHFFKHDKSRLNEYLDNVAAGKRTISGATLLPHELVMEALQWEKEPDPGSTAASLSEMNNRIITGQWNTMLERLRESGTLKNCIAVCDVSGSMGSLHVAQRQKIVSGAPVSPIFPAVALSLVLARLASPPFQNSFITFSSHPKVVTLNSPPDAKLSTVIREMGGADWGMNTNFNAVFMKLLLPMAVKHKLKKEDMIKRIFVFSDMQFDQARSSKAPSWETNHEKVVKAFNEAGYDVPELVYWNLAGRIAAKPVTKDTPGVAMVSGFSGNLLKLFMENEEIPEDEWTDVDKEGKETPAEAPKPSISPLDTMRKALNKSCYEGLRVFD